MKIAFVLSVLTLCLSTHADFDVPAMSLENCATFSEFAVDATVESFNENGSANLKIHAILKGKNPPKVLKTYLNCDPTTTMQEMTSAGSRYLLFISPGDKSKCLKKFEIREIDGKLECYELLIDVIHTYRWIALDSAKIRIAEAIRLER